MIDLIKGRLAPPLVVLQQHRDPEMPRLSGLAFTEPDVAQPSKRVPRPVPTGLPMPVVAVGRRVQTRRGPWLVTACQIPCEAVYELVG